MAPSLCCTKENRHILNNDSTFQCGWKTSSSGKNYWEVGYSRLSYPICSSSRPQKSLNVLDTYYLLAKSQLELRNWRVAHFITFQFLYFNRWRLGQKLCWQGIEVITLSLLTRLVIIILDKSVDNILIGTRAKQSIHKMKTVSLFANDPCWINLTKLSKLYLI